MTASENLKTETNAGAVFHDSDHWYATDWHKVNREVRRLQTRIVKAQQEGKRGKVKALQRLLTHSFSGKALAVRRVTENQGKKTAGVDKVTWDTPNTIHNGKSTLKNGSMFTWKPTSKGYRQGHCH